QTETEATGAPQKHHYTLNQQVGSITAKLERKTTKGKLSSSAPSVTSEVNSNALPANDPMEEPASESQENEFSLLNLHSAV
ncbi:hypothetical protein QU626_26865, partial [Klebsiella pneumoniae]|nr:hypothetical protein [Klebsiella pneumoniae]